MTLAPQPVTAPAGWEVESRWEARLQRTAHPVAYPFMTSLARRGPAVAVPGLGVVINDAATARQVLMDAEHFSKVGKGASSDFWTPVLGPSVLLNMDGDAHAALRGALSDLLTPRAVGALVEESMGERCGRLGERLAAGEAVDIAAAVDDMAGAVVCAMTGVGKDDDAVRATFAAVQSVTGQLRLHRSGLTRRQVAHAREVFGALGESAGAVYRDGSPTTIPGRMRELGLSEAEAVGAVGAFVVAGTETIVTFIPRLLAILAGTGWLETLGAARAAGVESPVSESRLIEESFRVTVPSPVMVRATVADAEVAGVRVKAGTRVIISTLNACRAYGAFAPEQPMDRDVRHLWFGAGAHFCIGMPLAVAQTRAVLGAVLDAQAVAGPVRVESRKPAQAVVFPRYAELIVRAAG